jgi:fucose permease
MAAGILLMNAGTFAVCLAGFAVNGIGIGLTLPTVNILILELNPTRSAAALSVLNFFWGAGAIVCKPFVDLLSGGRSITLTTIAIAAPLLISAALIATLPKGMEPRSAEPEPGSDHTSIPIWTTPLAWALALFNFIHVGFESGMGGWLTTYTERIDASASLDFLSPTFLYFFFFVAGRGIAPLFFRVANENAVLMISLLVILAGLVITLTADNVLMLSIGAAISGFGTSSIFPTSVSRFGRVFGAESTRRATPLFIAGTLGAAAVTWLIGFFSNQTEDLRYGMFVLGGSVVLLLVLQIGLIIRGTGPIR